MKGRVETRSLRIIAVAAFCALLIGCARFFGSAVTIQNESGKQLSEVRLSLAGKLVWTGNLSPGDRHTAYGFPDTDGTVTLSFTVERRSVTKAFGYVTPNSRDHHRIFVPPSLEPMYDFEVARFFGRSSN